jgi:hypothetical protein
MALPSSPWLSSGREVGAPRREVVRQMDSLRSVVAHLVVNHSGARHQNG